MLALALLTIVSLTLVALSFTSLNSRQKSQDLTVAIQIAEDQLGSFIHKKETLSTSEHSTFWDSGGITYPQKTVAVGETDYHYEITVRDLDIDNEEPNRLRYAEISVWWWSDTPDEARAGTGRRQFSLSGLIREVKHVDF